MSNEIILNADARLRTGTNKNREIRREDSMVPAVIYGNNEDTKNIKVPLNEITKACESELFYTQVLKIVLDGNEEKVVLKELQREPEKGKLLHADFQRVSSKTKLKVTVPVKFINEVGFSSSIVGVIFGVSLKMFCDRFLLIPPCFLGVQLSRFAFPMIEPLLVPNISAISVAIIPCSHRPFSLFTF